MKQNQEKDYRITTNLNNSLLKFDNRTKTSILLKENNVIIDNKIQLKKYVIEAFFNNSTNKNLHLGIIPNEIIDRIKKEVTDINENKIKHLFKEDINYALVINQDEIRHLKKDCLNIEDVIDLVNNLDDLIINFDTVRYTVYNNNQNALRINKKMNDGTHIALEIISNKNHMLRTHTIFLKRIDFEYKKRNIFPTLNEYENSLSKTSETDGLSIPSNNNVPQSNSNVKSSTSIN